MANVLGELFQDIADAIRSKTGTTDTLKPNQFPEAIEGITAGGGEGEKPFDCHSVTFVYDDKSYVRSVADGDTCADPVARGLIPTPTKESTAQYNYTFYGWGASDGGAADANILKNITEDKTVYAVFTATVRKYNITYLDDDGTVLHTEELNYGATPSYAPTKAGFVLKGWTPSIAKVTGDATYTAQWEEVIGGTCGENATWELNNAGLLTISGTGAMSNYSRAANQPWANYRDNITEIQVNSGITHIGNYAFADCANAQKITMRGVTTIGYYALNGCNKCDRVGSVIYVGTYGTWTGKKSNSSATVTLINNVDIINVGNNTWWGLEVLIKTYPDYMFTKS